MLSEMNVTAFFLLGLAVMDDFIVYMILWLATNNRLEREKMQTDQKGASDW